MDAEQRSAGNVAQAETGGGGWILGIVGSPILWGTAITVGFYYLIPYLPIEREFVARYFAGHWIEYCTTGMFFIGLTILGQKFWGHRFEREVLRQKLLTATGPATDKVAEVVAQNILGRIDQLPNRLRETRLAGRVRETCEYVISRRSGAALEEHLKYLAELAAEDLHGSYALVRTVTWAIPILGFLGTVIGITMAIATITPEQLETSLGDVTAGLAVAFDTTALSLALSMVLVFATFLIERAEGGALSDVEQFGISHLAPAFSTPAAEPVAGPWAAAEAKAAEQLLQRSEALINWQTNLWQQSLESLRTRWLETSERQQAELSASLRSGLGTTLTDHAQQLHETRSLFLHAFESMSGELARVVTDLRQSSLAQQETFTRQTAELWQQIGRELAAIRDEQRVQTENLTRSLHDTASTWHADLAAATSAVTDQLSELRRQGEILGGIVEQERDLVRVQDRLSDNLQAVRAAETFEQTLHSLNAAVHLLTARNRAAA